MRRLVPKCSSCGLEWPIDAEHECQDIETLRARVRDLEGERDEWRAKAMDVEKHPVVVALRQERDLALAGAGRMRRVIEKMMTPEPHEPGCGCYEEIMNETREVLETDAGRAELERVRRYEEVLGRVRDYLSAGTGWAGLEDAVRAALSGRGR